MQELGLSGCSPESSAVFPPPSLASTCCAEGLAAERLLPPAVHWPKSCCRRESVQWPAPRGTQGDELLCSLCHNGVSPKLDCSREPGHQPLLLGVEKEYGNGVPTAPCSVFFPLWAVAATLQSRGASKANPTAPWKEETRFIASSSDLYSQLCNSSRLDLCRSRGAGMFPLFFPVSWLVLSYCPFPKRWLYLTLNLVSVSAWPSPAE